MRCRFRLAAAGVVRLLSSVVGVLAVGGAVATAEPIRVAGQVFLSSAGGDFPDYHGPINEMIYSLAGAGLPLARGESLETIPVLGNRGGLTVTRSATPDPLVAGAVHSLSTRLTFTAGRAFEDGWPTQGRAYDIAGDFQFTGGAAVLKPIDFEGFAGRAPVTFAGTLSAFDIDTGALLFRHTLTGRGTGEVTFYPANSTFFQYNYALDPVPEPASLLLLGTGLGWVAMRVRGRRRVGRTTALTVAICLAAGVASADPFTATVGAMQILNVGGDVDIPVPHQEFSYALGRFLGDDGFNGDAFSVSGGGLRIVTSPAPVPFRAGALFNLSTGVTWTLGDFHGCAPDGTACGLYRSSGQFRFDAGNTTLRSDGNTLTGSSPFTFRGDISTRDTETQAPAFQRSVRGQGTATFTLFPDTGHYSYLYSVEPVPEPVTIVMLGGSLGALAVRKWRWSARRP